MQYAPIITIGISIIGLAITLLKMLGEQRKANQLKYDQDKRLEYKLRIHDLLLTDIMDFDMLLSKFESQSPLTRVDPLQIRKCVYEMLVDKTIVSFDDGSYTVDTVTPADDQDEEDNANS